MTIQFRPAQANDVSVAVPLIYSSGTQQFDYGFSSGDYPAEDFLRFAFANGYGFFGWRNHTVATVEGIVVGIGAFYSGRDYWRLSIGLVWQVLHFYPLLILPRVFWRILQLQSLMPAPSRNTHYVAHFAVAQQLRGQGIGTALLGYQQKQAQALKRNVYALDVAVDNPKAQALYQRLGFKEVRLQRFPGQISAVPDTWRMEMKI